MACFETSQTYRVHEFPKCRTCLLVRIEKCNISIWSPLTTAFRGGSIPSGKEWMQITAVARDFPERVRIAVKILNSKPQHTAVRRPSWKPWDSFNRGHFPRLASIRLCEINVRAPEVDNVLAVGKPGSIVGEDVTDSLRRS